MRTPIVDWFTVPPYAVWCIGQHTNAERAALEKAARAGSMNKVRAYWNGIAGPLKMVFIPTNLNTPTIVLPRKLDCFDYRRAPICIRGDSFTITPARYAKNKYVIQTKGVDGYKSRACRLAGAITNDAYVGRSKGYTASAAQAEKFYRLYVAGWDASYMTRELEAPQP